MRLGMASELLSMLRDTWPQQKGLAALLFQDDLFRRLRRLEAIAEGKAPDNIDGFLPDEFPAFDCSADYLAAWNNVEVSVEIDGWTYVDGIEDDVCQWCEDMIPEKIAFFSAALECGELDDEWTAKAELLLEAEQVQAPEVTIITLEPERKPSAPTRRRLAGLPITPTRVRRLVRKTRRHK